MPPKTEEPKYKHCTNCGQGVRGAVATKAADPATVYCSYCGRRLKDGKCPSKDCPYFGTSPTGGR
jgi:hypothetical protein